MRIEAISEILENPNINKVVFPKNKTKFFLQWQDYIKAKLKEIRL